ncbi:transposable element Tc1 transposase [Trichonephila clavipes]|nr:transposable element Tc1 transposase [Trichonephila clavipes]
MYNAKPVNSFEKNISSQEAQGLGTFTPLKYVPETKENNKEKNAENRQKLTVIGLLIVGTGEYFPPLEFHTISGVAIYRPFGNFSLSLFVLSPVWLSMPATSVHLAACHDEFRWPRYDHVRQLGFLEEEWLHQGKDHGGSWFRPLELSIAILCRDEVEKLAYQLNEEAEWPERPIRRLSKMMYGSTCADMQVDLMGERLSSIKHVVGREMANNQSVRRHLDAFIRGRIIGKLEEGLSVTRTAIRGFSSGRPRGTTPADDRYIVLQARRNRRQTAGEIARHTTQATGRPISRFTVARRLHGGGLFARRPVRCVPLTPAHRRRRSLWCQEHRNWRDNKWGRVHFTDESRFSLSSDSHRILIWRERGSRNHPSNVIERDRYGGRGVLVWGGIMLGSRTDLHIFAQFLFMDDNAPCNRTVAAEQLLESEDIERMDWPARSPDLNPIEHISIPATSSVPESTTISELGEPVTSNLPENTVQPENIDSPSETNPLVESDTAIDEQSFENLQDKDILHKAALLLRKSVLQAEKKSCHNS